MQAVLSEITLREIDRMTRQDLLEAFSGFSEVCRHQPTPSELAAMPVKELREFVCEARRQYRVRGY